MVNRYIEMKEKWEELVRREESGNNFNENLLSPGAFCVHIIDGSRDKKGRFTLLEITGFFIDPLDAIGYFRFVSIPVIMNCDTQADGSANPGVAESYLLKYDYEHQQQIDHVIGMMDKVMIAGIASKHDLDIIQVEFNNSFDSTNPTVQILAWGSIFDVLSSPYFANAFEGDNWEGDGYDIDDSQPVELKKLLDSGRFDEHNKEHIGLAGYFFEKYRKV